MYIKVLNWLKVQEVNDPCPKSIFSIKLLISLHELKQFGHIWYNHLSEYLLKEVYKNDDKCPWVFIKKWTLNL